MPTRPKAYLIDMDDTLTRVPDVQTYRQATHAAYSRLAGGATPMPLAEFGQLHGGFYDSGQCHFTGLGARFGVDPLLLFRAHHDHMAFDTLLFDHDSAAAVRRLAGRALLFTDGARVWAQRCLDRLALPLEINARDDFDNMQPIKAADPARWTAALDHLSAMTGETLTPSDVLMVDDSARVLRYARNLGFQTAQCHFGNPGRAFTHEFDYEAESFAALIALADRD